MNTPQNVTSIAKYYEHIMKKHKLSVNMPKYMQMDFTINSLPV